MKKKGQAEDKLGLVLHIIGAILAVPILVLCTVRGAIEYGAAGVLTALAFSISMLVLSIFSAIYHGRKTRGKDDVFFRVMDFCSIFFLSAGAYTPIALIALMKVEPAVAWTLFGAVWALAIWGIIMNLVGAEKYKDLSMACYIGLSWCVILCLPRIITLLPPIGTILMFTGAATYTAAGMVFGFDRGSKQAHSIFHILLLIGNICYGLMILLCVL